MKRRLLLLIVSIFMSAAAPAAERALAAPGDTDDSSGTQEFPYRNGELRLEYRGKKYVLTAFAVTIDGKREPNAGRLTVYRGYGRREFQALSLQFGANDNDLVVLEVIAPIAAKWPLDVHEFSLYLTLGGKRHEAYASDIPDCQLKLSRADAQGAAAKLDCPPPVSEADLTQLEFSVSR